MTLLEWIKANAKEGANLAEVEEMISGMDKLGSIKTKEEAMAFIKNNGFFQSAVDSLVSRAVESHDEKFRSEKLPSILDEERVKLRQELNPEETEAEKELREMREWKQQQVAKEKRRELEDQLAKKAKDLGFDPEKARRYAAFGEDAAFRELEADSSFLKSQVDTEVKSYIEKEFGGKAPTKGKGEDPAPKPEDYDMAKAMPDYL